MCVCNVCGKKADASGTEDWVQCDDCELWFHFECAGVDASVQDRDWSCASCTRAHSVDAPHTSANAMQPATTTITTTSAATPAPATTSINTNRENQSDTSSLKLDAVQRNAMNEPGDQQRLMLAMLEERRAAEERFIEQKYNILSQMNNAGLSMSNFLPSMQHASNNGPSSAQIAARQAIPKDLPTFSGDPEEWPMFISTFDHSTSVAGFSDVENMLRLQRCLKGRARELVKDKLLLPAMVPDVINTLKMFFGRPEHILERMIDKVRKLPCPKDKLESLIEFALAVRNICATMETCKLDAHLNNPMLVKELVDKLPNHHKLNWAMYPRDNVSPSIKVFSDWLYRIAEAASTVVSPAFMYKTGSINTHSSNDSCGSKTQSKEVQSNVIESQPKQTMKCIACGTSDHSAAHCTQFQNASEKERWNMVKANKACYTCLKSHRKSCFSKKKCGVNGCMLKHHPLLHSDRTQKSENKTNDQAVVTTHQSGKHSTQYFRIMPVNLHSAGKTIEVFAFLDEGSSVTLIDESMFRELGIKGVPAPICLQWTSNTTRNENNSVRASIQISALNSSKLYWLNDVHTVENIALPKQSMNAEELQSEYSHLRGIPLPSYSDIRPMLLIGTDNWKIAVPRKIREGKRSEPIASKCLLGWCVQGTSNAASYVTMHHCDCGWQELNDVVKDSFNLDAVKPHNLQSNDDKKAMEILSRTCTKTDERFEIGLLWRNENESLPESYTNALNRLTCLKNKISREPEMYDKINDQIDNLIRKGYALQLSENEMAVKPDRTWYLPIFIALNPNKPNKVRLVWDAAAKSHGQSLNDFLLTGPDLLKPLVEVLLAFRVGQVAVCGDIAEMFHRISIRDEDMHAQRFMWYDKSNGQTKVYVMRAMTFGISCGPCIAHYVRNKNAEEYSHIYPRAYEAITNAHYVDDYIDTADNDEAAFEVADQVRKVHLAGGFEIRNWASNSAVVLAKLLGGNPGVQTSVQFGDTEKILGMYWEPQSDVFKFILRFTRLRRDLFTQDVVPTKREVLQVLMSVFDPLGLLACYTVGLKILIQRVWRANIGWDEEFPETLYEDWLKWRQLLPLIEAVEVPRCYSRNLKFATDVGIHTFVDASEHAYAAVCYVRVRQGDDVEVSLVAAKSKVAPLKPISIPRLELEAAVVGVRLTQKVIKIRGLEHRNTTYWSDSKTVLQWLNMDPRSFQQFVMHRVGEILESSDSKQWRWVPTKLNVADLATKINSAVDGKQWLKGPNFLFLQSSMWPSSDTHSEVSDTTELRKRVCVIYKAAPIALNVEYFSKWRNLYRAVATFILYIFRLKTRLVSRIMPKVVTPDMIEIAENILFKQAQAEIYSSEINALYAGHTLSKQSKLYPLNVYLDDKGILRIRSRLDSINEHTDTIVLPRESYITFLIVRDYHEKNHHMAHETVVNNVKGKYCIPRLRVLYNKVRKSCQRCKINNALPEPPQMSPIPAARNFMARRGTPADIFSDNGTNFKATEKLVREKLITFDFDQIAAKYDRIKWRFNPPGAPHMGGAWERLVRTTKNILRSICPSYSFNDESLRCALMEVEFIINSRPLTFVSLESSDDIALTPNHMLLGSADGHKPACSDGMDLRQRWHKTQLFADVFWQRWVKEYTPILTRRVKWLKKATPIVIDDVVIVIDETLPRNLWPKGRVISTIVAKDGQVRRVTVKTPLGIMERPATKIAKLDVGNSLQANRSFTVDHEANTFLMNGKPFRYVSGSFHYFRALPQVWEERLNTMRAAGLNAIDTYVEWALHNPHDGVYNWEGIADVERFIRLAQNAGFYIILRPGPYICAERDNGGLPHWLFTRYPNIKVRTSDPNYQREVSKWYAQIMQRLQRFLYGNLGRIIMVQVENEYGDFHACDAKHLIWLRDETEKYVQGKALLFTTDIPNLRIKCGKIDGVYATVDFGLGTDHDENWRMMRTVQPTGPLVNSEFYPGWLTHWGEDNQRRDGVAVAAALRQMLEVGASVNFYMFFGGTNFGFTAGANNYSIEYAPDVTSYDYDAVMDESGNVTKKFELVREVIADFLEVPPATSCNGCISTPKRAYGKVALKPITSLLSTVGRMVLAHGKPIKAERPLTFESLDQYSGLVLYETELPKLKLDPTVLTVNELHDRAFVFVDDELVGTLARKNSISSMPLSNGLGSRLQLLVENQGRINFETLNDTKGILGAVTVDLFDGTKQELLNWTTTSFPLEIQQIKPLINDYKTRVLELVPKTEVLRNGPVLYYGEFEVEKLGDTYLNTIGWGKGVAYVNGFNLGRYWPLMGPQLTLYLPKDLLKIGSNTLVILEYQRSNLDIESGEYFMALDDKPQLDG